MSRGSRMPVLITPAKCGLRGRYVAGRLVEEPETEGGGGLAPHVRTLICSLCTHEIPLLLKQGAQVDSTGSISALIRATERLLRSNVVLAFGEEYSVVRRGASMPASVGPAVRVLGTLQVTLSFKEYRKLPGAIWVPALVGVPVRILRACQIPAVLELEAELEDGCGVVRLTGGKIRLLGLAALTSFLDLRSRREVLNLSRTRRLIDIERRHERDGLIGRWMALRPPP